MSFFTFGAPPIEEANDNPDIDFSNLQINSQVAAGGVAAGAQALQVAAGGVAAGAGIAAGAGAGVAAGAQSINFTKVFYFNNPQYTPAKMCFNDFVRESKTCMTFGGTPFLSCGATSKQLRFLNSKLHMQYLLMADKHIEKYGIGEVFALNNFLFETYEDVLHPSRMVMFRIYKNFRDYIFKPVYHALYSTVPPELINEPMKKELFNVWLTCTV